MVGQYASYLSKRFLVLYYKNYHTSEKFIYSKVAEKEFLLIFIIPIMKIVILLQQKWLLFLDFIL